MPYFCVLFALGRQSPQAEASIQSSSPCETWLESLDLSRIEPRRSVGKHLIRDAILFSKEKHSGQFRKFGRRLPYIVHPIRTASILKRFTSDPEIIAAGILHDLMENAGVSREEIALRFGERVAKLVEELTTSKEEQRAMGKGPYLLKKMLEISDDALLIKLADRLDNTSDFEHAPESFVQSYRAETQMILEGLLQRRVLNEAQLQLIREIEARISYFSP